MGSSICSPASPARASMEAMHAMFFYLSILLKGFRKIAFITSFKRSRLRGLSLVRCQQSFVVCAARTRLSSLTQDISARGNRSSLSGRTGSSPLLSIRQIRHGRFSVLQPGAQAGQMWGKQRAVWRVPYCSEESRNLSVCMRHANMESLRDVNTQCNGTGRMIVGRDVGER